MLLIVSAVFVRLVRAIGLLYEDARWYPGLAPDWPKTWPSRALTTWSFTLAPALPAMHTVQLVLHLATALLLAAVLRHMMTSRGAWVSAAIFLCAPIQMEAVGYLTARTDVLSTFWILAALWCGLEATSGRLTPIRCALAGFGTWMALMLAGFSKELGAVGIPILCWTVCRWRQVPRYAVVVVVAVVGLVGVACVSQIVIWLTPNPMFGGGTWTWPQFLGYQWSAFGRLLALVVWPNGLSIDHDPVGSSRLWALTPGAALACLWPVRHLRVVRWAIGFVALALVSRFVVRQHEFLSEHQMYLAMVGISPILAVVGSMIVASIAEVATLWRLEVVIMERYHAEHQRRILQSST